MIHVQHPGLNDHVIFLLHPTGGHASSLFQVGQALDRHATLIGLQGDISENGHLRFFSRYSDGALDMRSLAEQTQAFDTTIKHIIQKYQLQDKKLTIVGYSNGANLIQSYLSTFPSLFSKAILFHPTQLPSYPDFIKPDSHRMLISYGEQDPYVSFNQYQALQAQFPQALFVQTNLGHTLVEEEIQAAKQFIQVD